MRYLSLSLLLILLAACGPSSVPFGEAREYRNEIINVDADQATQLAQQIEKETAITLADGLEIDLWASDSLVQDPIAISIDPQGRIYYTRASRQANSEFDIRGHRDWMTASISFESVEDRRAFLRETFSADSEQSQRHLKDLNGDGVRDWRDLTVEKEQVWSVVDTDGDGIADQAQLYLEDFNEEVTDVANGLEYHDGEIFIGAAPDLWRTKDTDQDGRADRVGSISHGYAVHIGFSGHGMSGVTVGPQGRIWWGIGDIGANIVDQDGKRWKYPNRGVVVRAEPDGSNFEVYCMGVRNTHEFVFDHYGNLITEDNDGDHRGERERLVYLINGSDSGWRTNWQFGKYTDPKSNEYKVWMDERLSVPHWEGQAAYILPPIQNYVNGPTGMVLNPGTALGPEWYNHFFIAEFRGSPANSPIHAFTLDPDGAGFKLANTQEVVKGVLPTGIDFGADGAMYFSDWIDGWGLKNEGRIWKIDVPNGPDQVIRKETQALLTADFSSKAEDELADLLGHQDRRVRQKAQFELAKRPKEGLKVFKTVMNGGENEFARIHAMWGLHQLARKEAQLAENYLPLLEDSSEEMIAQAAKMLGDLRYAAASEALIPLVNHANPRIQLMSIEALGRIAEVSEVGDAAFEAIVEAVRQNNNEDMWLRMASMVALGRMGDTESLVALQNDPSMAVRITAVVALRRMEAPEVAEFLDDDNELVVTEAARAINDDWNIEEALPALADLLGTTNFISEPLLRRVINANVEVGQEKNWKMLLDYSQSEIATPAMRAEAMAALSNWGDPAVFDRVDGRYRGEMKRDDSAVRAAAEPLFVNSIQASNPAVQIAAIQASGRLGLNEVSPTLFELLQKNSDAGVKVAALEALQQLKAENLDEALQLALADPEGAVRSKALELLPGSGLAAEEALPLFESIMANGSEREQQATLGAMSEYKTPAIANFLANMMDKLAQDQVNPAIQLDLLEAAAAQDDEAVQQKLAAYEAARAEAPILEQYKEALQGGNAWWGQRIFYGNEAAQCVRCHAVFEVGGNAGPGLLGVGNRLSREQLLESMIAPSAQYALGYEVVILELKDESTVSGVVTAENEQSITVKTSSGIETIEKSRIDSRESVPSAMPNMKDILSKRELRDVVAFLSSLEEEES
jgi:putative membrane-bound dehydrogenase-like protein